MKVKSWSSFSLGSDQVFVLDCRIWIQIRSILTRIRVPDQEDILYDLLQYSTVYFKFNNINIHTNNISIAFYNIYITEKLSSTSFIMQSGIPVI